MQRYFFDAIYDGRTEYNFKGREFEDLTRAIHYAELIAFDIGFSSDEEQVRREVKVRDVAGIQLFQIMVPPNLELVAA